jgi:SAM-dependent methyltransferase
MPDKLVDTISTPADLPDQYRRVWERKPVLRRLYRDYYRRILAACAPGRTLEIGGGSGNLKEYAPNVISFDIVASPWLDLVADAQSLPFRAASFDNIVMFDVLHHIEQPFRFFEEAQRLLRPGGRVVMLEPAITPVSQVFYRLMHPEPVDMSADPFGPARPDPERSPWDANQAIPTLLFGRYGDAFALRFPKLRLIARQQLALASYPLSGGFRPWSLIPGALVEPLLRAEEKLMPLLGRLMAFRMLAVLERRD